jgi:hypothetical protein
MTCALRDVEDLPFSHLQTQLADQIGWLASGNELKVFECFSRVGVAIINLFPLILKKKVARRAPMLSY